MITFNDPRALVGPAIFVARDASLGRLVPDLWEHDHVIYVGAKSTRAHYLDRFVAPPQILEAHAPNAHYLCGKGFDATEGDVRVWTPPEPVNVVFWWHGPEHVEADELAATLTHIESYTRGLVVLGCPWGDYPQGAVDGNDYEIHRQAIEPETLADLGYVCDVVGTPGRGSNITAVKYL